MLSINLKSGLWTKSNPGTSANVLHAMFKSSSRKRDPVAIRVLVTESYGTGSTHLRGAKPNGFGVVRN
jgi:hypothetical protein